MAQSPTPRRHHAQHGRTPHAWPGRLLRASLLPCSLGLAALPLSGQAQGIDISGAWTNAGTTQVPSIPQPPGTVQTVFSAYNGGTYDYSLFRFTVGTTGLYTATVKTSGAINTSWFLTGSFSPGTPPGTPIGNFFAGIFSGSTLVNGFYPETYTNLSLAAGTQYSMLLAYNSSSPSLVATYGFAVSGAGAVCLGALACSITGPTATLSSALAGVTPAFQGGTLRLDTSGLVIATNFTVDNSTTNTIDAAGRSASFSGVFSDATTGGTLTIGNTGSGGVISLDGASTYTGSTTIGSGATLAVNGSITSPVTIQDGGMLRGTGFIGGSVEVAGGGVLAPGNSPGTLTVAGPVALAPGATAQFDIDGTGTATGAGNYSRLLLVGPSGTLAAGGILAPTLRGITGNAGNGYTPSLGTRFDIISAAAGITGSFAGLAQPAGLAANTRFDALYAPTAISLVVTPAQYGTPATAGWATPVGQALDRVRPAAGIAMTAAQAAVFAPLYQQSAAGVAQALQQAAPLVYADRLALERDAFHNIGNAIGAELQTRRGSPAATRTTAVAGPGNTTAWFNANGAFSKLNDAGNGTPGYRGTIGGVVGGIDTALPQNARAGLAFGFDNIGLTTGNRASYTGQSAQLMAYGSLERRGFFLDATLGAAFNEGHASRTLAAYGTSARGETSSTGAGGSLRLGKRFQFAGWTIEPGATLRGLALSSGATTETRAGLAGQRIAGTSLGSAETELGARADRRFPLRGRYTLAASAQFGWAHEMLETNARVSAAYLGLPGSGFSLRNPATGRDALVAGAVATLETGTPLRAFLGYNLRAAERYTAQNITAGLRYTF